MPRIQMTESLLFDDLYGCSHRNDTGFASPLAFVHACKDPCHKHAVGYAKNLTANHPHYLALERGHHLYLNLVDPPVPLFKMESFDLFFDFVDREIAQRPVLIHCNRGESRAPSLSLVYMAKRLKLLPDDSYVAARTAFEEKYPYNPGQGIVTFLEQNWARIGQKISAVPAPIDGSLR